MTAAAINNQEAKRILNHALEYVETKTNQAVYARDLDSEEVYTMAGNLIYASRHAVRKAANMED